ncbi:MAG: LLM class flavin-dependent oxidoreductase [Bacteroidota bacterium]
MKLSILDQAPVSSGASEAEALKNMERGAILADELGYERFWIAEHHNAPGVVSSAPEIAMAYLAGKTSRIRLGSGGTMIMHYSPYKMAEVFKTLSAFAPGRIDFGGGRAPGGDNFAIYALSEGREPMLHNMYDKFTNVLKFMNDEAISDPVYSRVKAHPTGIQLPEAWMLGSTGNSAIEAARMGVGYSYVHFFNGMLDKDVIAAYRNNFKPSAYLDKPKVIVSYFVTVAETREEALFQSKPADIGRLQLYKGNPGPRLSPEEARDYVLTAQEQDFMKQQSSWHIKGSIEEVADFLTQQQYYYGFDEVMLCTIPHSIEFKLQEYRMLAKALM